MPPRPASGRRRPRIAGLETDETSNRNSLSAFPKPNLPPLQGTPSSRRQYSYGADVEPLPSRPGRGLQRTQVLDLSNAVKSALERPEDDELQGAQESQQSGKYLRRSNEETQADELAGAGPQPPTQRQPSYLSGPGPAFSQSISRPTFPLRGQLPEGSDADDVRSFGMESDFYGDATIESTPRSLPRPLSQRDNNSAASALASQTGRRQKHSLQDSENEVDLVRQPSWGERRDQTSATFSRPANRPASRPGSDWSARQTKAPLDEAEDEEESESQSEEDESEYGSEEESEEESEADDLVRETRPPPVNSTNTPIPGRVRDTSNANLQAKTRVGGPSPAGSSESAVQARQPNRSSNHSVTRTTINSTQTRQVRQSKNQSSSQPRPTRQRAHDSPQASSDSGRWLSRATATTNFPSLFAQAKFLASSPFSIGRRYPSDESERDAAIQREIQAAEAEVDRELRQIAAEESRERWNQRFLWLKSLLPLGRWSETRDESASIDEDDDDNDDVDQQSSWVRFLNPWTPIRATAGLVESLLHWLMGLIHFIIPTHLWRKLSSIFGFLPHILVGFMAFALAFALATQFAASTDGEWAPNAIEATWRTLGDVRNKLADIVPTVSWPNRDRWVDISDLWEDEGRGNAKLEEFLGRMEKEFLLLKSAGRIHDASLEKLETVVPRVVHMELKDGQPVVSQEFWHALRDLIRSDGGFLTFDKDKNYEITSEKQWKAIATRLVGDPTFTSKLNISLDAVETRIGNQVNSFWETWVKDNDERIRQILGSAVDQVKAAGSQREFEERLSKIVKEQLSDVEQRQGQVVSRDEFLRHLRNEFATHRSEIRGELHELQPRLEQLIQDSVELATKEIPHGMSKGDIITLVNGQIRQALADVNLEAMAKGRIHSHWDTELRNQVNYFAVGSGAIIDAKHTSNTYDPFGGGIISSNAYRKGLRGASPFPPLAALEPWQDEGDCWCAARSINPRGNPHGASLAVQLSYRIVPQHLVIEHILPGATTEPGARPKIIEVYADVNDPQVRERVRDFSAVYFPEDQSDWNFTPADYPSRFVKISQFTYEGAEIHDGVHVHRLSSELMSLGAETDHVIVRAVSNYGAKHHTCFYRVRLYGHNAELVGIPSDEAVWP